MAYSIIGISGGGVRGLLSANALSVLTTQELNKVDCFAGTSTGGILALGAAAGYTFKELEGIYRKWIPEIFKPRRWVDRIFNFGQLRRARYDNDGLIKACQAAFGTMTMSDLTADCVVPAVVLDSIDPDNGLRSSQTIWYTRDMPGAQNQLVWEVAVATSSAPTYLPSYKGKIDGGCSANNPSAKAVALAFSRGFPLEDIALLAVTTGSAPMFKEGMRHDYGLAQWATDVIPLIMKLHEQNTLDTLKLCDLGFYGLADFKLREDVALDSVGWAKTFSPHSYSGPEGHRAIADFRKLLNA